MSPPLHSTASQKLDPKEKRHILVTGGAGFIGSWFVRHMVTTYPHYTITNLDALGYAGNLDNLKDVEKASNYRFVEGDIRDEGLVDGLMAEADVCVNFAAQTHVDRSITGPSLFVSTNVWGTQVLLEAARRHELQKFVQISTDEVYGSLGPTGLFREDTPLDPSSPYSASKAAADMLVLSYFRTYEFPVNVTRCSNNYGPYQYPEKLIPFFILKATQGERVPVYGDGLNVRDWIHVTDHNRAVDCVIHQGIPGEVYNIGASNEQTNLAITEQILTSLGKPKDFLTYVKDRPGHDRRYAIDSTKTKAELGWEPVTPFSKGLQETIQWYLDNPAWIDRVLARQKAFENKPQSASAFLPGSWAMSTP